MLGLAWQLVGLSAGVTSSLSPSLTPWGNKTWGKLKRATVSCKLPRGGQSGRSTAKDVCPAAQAQSRVLVVGPPCWPGMISVASCEMELCSPTPRGGHLKQGYVIQIIIKRKQAVAGLSRGDLGPESSLPFTGHWNQWSCACNYTAGNLDHFIWTVGSYWTVTTPQRKIASFQVLLKSPTWTTFIGRF